MLDYLICLMIGIVEVTNDNDEWKKNIKTLTMKEKIWKESDRFEKFIMMSNILILIIFVFMTLAVIAITIYIYVVKAGFTEIISF